MISLPSLTHFMNSYMYEFIFLLWIHAWIHFFIWKCIYNFKWFYFTPYFPNMNSLWINFSYNYHILNPYCCTMNSYNFVMNSCMNSFLYLKMYIFLNDFILPPIFIIWIHYESIFHIITIFLNPYFRNMNSYHFIYEFIQFHLLWIHTISFRNPYKHYYEFIQTSFMNS